MIKCTVGYSQECKMIRKLRFEYFPSGWKRTGPTLSMAVPFTLCSCCQGSLTQNTLDAAAAAAAAAPSRSPSAIECDRFLLNWLDDNLVRNDWLCEINVSLVPQLYKRSHSSDGNAIRKSRGASRWPRDTIDKLAHTQFHRGSNRFHSDQFLSTAIRELFMSMGKNYLNVDCCQNS